MEGGGDTIQEQRDRFRQEQSDNKKIFEKTLRFSQTDRITRQEALEARSRRLAFIQKQTIRLAKHEAFLDQEEKDFSTVITKHDKEGNIFWVPSGHPDTVLPPPPPEPSLADKIINTVKSDVTTVITGVGSLLGKTISAGDDVAAKVVGGALNFGEHEAAKLVGPGSMAASLAKQAADAAAAEAKKIKDATVGGLTTVAEDVEDELAKGADTVEDALGKGASFIGQGIKSMLPWIGVGILIFAVVLKEVPTIT